MIVNSDLESQIWAERDALFGAVKRESSLSRPNPQRAGELAYRAACFVVDYDAVGVMSGLKRDRGLGRLCGMRPGDAYAHYSLHEEQQQR